jgi:2'-5' RNA ligase
MSYSLWLVPEEDKVADFFTTLISRLAAEHEGPPFEPHCTLLGNVEFDLPALVDRLTPVTKQMMPLEIESGSVEYSTTYYQCVFVRITPNPHLMQLYDEAKLALELSEPSVFMPHISLYYGNLPYHKRQEIIDRISIPSTLFTVAKLVITPGGEHPPSEWKHVATLPFAA